VGHSCEVYAWRESPRQADDDSQEPEYKYHLEYAGESFEDALAKVFELRANGIRCIKLVWRPF